MNHLEPGRIAPTTDPGPPPAAAPDSEPAPDLPESSPPPPRRPPSSADLLTPPDAWHFATSRPPGVSLSVRAGEDGSDAWWSRVGPVVLLSVACVAGWALGAKHASEARQAVPEPVSLPRAAATVVEAPPGSARREPERLAVPPPSPSAVPTGTNEPVKPSAEPESAPRDPEGMTITLAPQPVAYDREVLRQVMRWAVRNAEECHKGGRASGSADLFVTFSPSGKVSDAHLVGEPIASAPVARCIVDFAKAMILPAFDGPAFTVSRSITIR